MTPAPEKLSALRSAVDAAINDLATMVLVNAADYPEAAQRLSDIAANLQSALRAEAAPLAEGMDGLTDRLYQAAWFAQPFVKHAAETASDPSLARECLAKLDEAIADYRATPTAQRDPLCAVQSTACQYPKCGCQAEPAQRVAAGGESPEQWAARIAAQFDAMGESYDARMLRALAASPPRGAEPVRWQYRKRGSDDPWKDGEGSINTDYNNEYWETRHLYTHPAAQADARAMVEVKRKIRWRNEEVSRLKAAAIQGPWTTETIGRHETALADLYDIERALAAPVAGEGG